MLILVVSIYMGILHLVLICRSGIYIVYIGTPHVVLMSGVQDLHVDPPHVVLILGFKIFMGTPPPSLLCEFLVSEIYMGTPILLC